MISTFDGPFPFLEKRILSHSCIDELVQMLIKCRKEKDQIQALHLHSHICGCGLDGHRYLQNYLVQLLVDVGAISDAQQVFDKILCKHESSWNSLIYGYTKCSKPQCALDLYDRMRENNSMHPSGHTVVALFKACTKLVDLEQGLKIHASISKCGLLEKDPFVGTSLIDMYAKCGAIDKAQDVFGELPVRDVISWTTLIGGYVEHGHAEVALKLFEGMQLEGMPPDASTYICSLKACGNLGAAFKGLKIHADIATKWCLGVHIVLDNTLIDMYAKCGLLSVAQELFDKLSLRDVVSWNSLIAGYAQHGQSGHVFRIFQRMLINGVEPDLVSFAIILHACSRMGLLKLSQTYFNVMSKDYGIIPTIDHHTSMVDLLGRVGQLDKAVIMINKSPVSNHIAIWRRVLDACKNWGNIELGKRTFEHAVHLIENNDPASDRIYVKLGV